MFTSLAVLNLYNSLSCDNNTYNIAFNNLLCQVGPLNKKGVHSFGTVYVKGEPLKLTVFFFHQTPLVPVILCFIE